MVKEVPYVLQLPCYFPWQRLLFKILAEVFAFCCSGLWLGFFSYNRLLPTKTAPLMLDKLNFFAPLSVPEKAIKLVTFIFLPIFAKGRFPGNQACM